MRNPARLVYFQTNSIDVDKYIQINLIDFGASRPYTEDFVDAFGRLLLSAGNGDREECVNSSLRLRYLTGEENDVGTYSDLFDSF